MCNPGLSEDEIKVCMFLGLVKLNWGMEIPDLVKLNHCLYNPRYCKVKF